MKYRRKPIEIEAEQFLPENGIFPQGLFHRKGKFWITTDSGTNIVQPGDWILTDVKGNKYPCKHEVFVESYEVVQA